MELHIPEPNQADQCLLCPGTPWPIPARATGIYSRGRRGGTLQWQKEALQEKQKLSVHGCSAASVTPGKETHGTCSPLPPLSLPGRPQEEVPLWFGGPFFKMRKVVFSQGKKHTSSTHTEINFPGSQTWHESYESYLNELFVLYKEALH